MNKSKHHMDCVNVQRAYIALKTRATREHNAMLFAFICSSWLGANLEMLADRPLPSWHDDWFKPLAREYNRRCREDNLIPRDVLCSIISPSLFDLL